MTNLTILDPKQTVANLVLDHSECAPVFKRFHIDFCCRGNISVEEAAKEKGIEVATLVGELSNAIEKRTGVHADPRELSTHQLVVHIVTKHHEYLRQALPFVKSLAIKVSRVHGDHNPKLRDLETVVRELADVLVPHLNDEEKNLFPTLAAEQPDMTKSKALLSEMAEEHLAVAKLLESIQTASDNFTLPHWACTSYRTLFAELQELESDIFTHVHLENHVLKPRFAA